MASSSSAAFRSALIPRVPSLLRALMAGIAGGVPRSHLTQLSELLHACLLRLAEQARPALHDLLEEPGFPSERANAEAKSRFGRAILRCAWCHLLASAAATDMPFVLQRTNGQAGSTSGFRLCPHLQRS